jgi:hydroxymethylpyrimidine pyrophosphatase-like HAD family hydrolase
MSAPKTVFCDIDGTLLPHTGNIIENLNSSEALVDVIKSIAQWDKLNYRIILTTGRQESTREQTKEQLRKAGIMYSDLIMGLPNGERVLINDKKPNGLRNTAYAINLVRNEGFEHIDLNSKYVTIPDKDCLLTNKKWVEESFIEYNDKYVIKKCISKKDDVSPNKHHTKQRVTYTVISGTLKIITNSIMNSIEEHVCTSGESLIIEPYTIYKIVTVIDSVYIRVSTNEIWDEVYLNN